MSLPYDKELYYIESTGTQYIDTGFKPNQDTRIVATMQCVTSTNYGRLFGCGTYGALNSVMIDYETGITGTLHIKYGNNSSWTNVSSVHGDYETHTYDFNKNNFYLDGELVSSNTYGAFQSTSNLGIFTYINGNNVGSNTEFFIGRLYGFQIYDNDVLVRDFIPIKVGQEGCLYDKVTQEIYRNAGSGSFVLGSPLMYHSPLINNVRRRLLYAKPKKVYDYLCFTALESGTFSFTIESSIRLSEMESISYSLDGKTWVDTPNVNNTLVTITTPTVNAGDKVYWKGRGTAFSLFRDSNNWRAYFSSTGNFDVSGNIMSMLYGKNMDLPITKGCTFVHAFRNCTKLIHAHELVLPTDIMNESFYGMFYGCTSLVSAPIMNLSTLPYFCCCYMFRDCTSLTDITSLTTSTTAGESCCANMFYNCSSLTTIPNGFLPSTTLTQLCYQYMFYGCTSLVNVPSNLLPATTLAPRCYEWMFHKCTSLQTAPDLPALTLVTNCYYSMFREDSSLNYIKMMATDIGDNGSTIFYWVDRVSSNGTFVRNPNATWWVTGQSGIPNGWLCEDGTEQSDEVIVFEDPEAKRVITSRYGGVIPDTTYSSHWPVRIKGKVNGEITYRQAAHIATITQAFQNNTELIKFHEFQYFTAIDGSGSSWFQNCKTLQEITLPNKDNLKLASSAFMQCRDITVFNNWNKVTYLNQYVFYEVTDPFMTLVAGLDFSKITNFGGNDLRGNTAVTQLYLPSIRYANNFYQLVNCTLLDIGHDNIITFGTLLFADWARTLPHEANIVFRCPAVIKTNWTGMDMHQNATGCVFNLYVYEKYYNDYVNDAYWSTADNIYKIGGAEWVAQFGSSSEWADYPNSQAPNVDLTESEVEYIRPLTNINYDTGVIPTSNTHVVVRCKYINTNNGLAIGEQESNSLRYYLGMMGGYFRFACGSVEKYTTADTNIHTFELYGNGTYVIDGTSYDIGSTLGTTTVSMGLLSRRGTNNSYGYQATNCELYYAKIYEGETLVKDYVPYRKRGDMYLKDKVSGSIEWLGYGDNFDIGNDVNS